MTILNQRQFLPCFCRMRHVHDEFVISPAVLLGQTIGIKNHFARRSRIVQVERNLHVAHKPAPNMRILSLGKFLGFRERILGAFGSNFGQSIVPHGDHGPGIVFAARRGKIPRQLQIFSRYAGFFQFPENIVVKRATSIDGRLTRLRAIAKR